MTVISVDFLKGQKRSGQTSSLATASFKSFKVTADRKDPTGLNESEFHLMAFIHRFKEYFNFEYMSWVEMDEKGFNSLCSYPERWVDFYIDHRLHKRDKIVMDSGLGLSPFFWSGEFKKTSQSQEVNDLARQYGIVTGITIPMDFRQHGITTLSFSSAHPFKEFARNILPRTRDLLFLSYLFQTMMRASQQNIGTSQDAEYLMDLYKDHLPQRGEMV